MQIRMDMGRYIITLPTPFQGETEWELDGYLVNLRGAALRQVARDLGINVKSSSKVGDIRHDMRNILIAMADRSGMDVLADLLSLDGGKTPAKVCTITDECAECVSGSICVARCTRCGGTNSEPCPNHDAPDYVTAVGARHDGPDYPGDVAVAVRQARAEIRMAMHAAGIAEDSPESHSLLIRAFSAALAGGKDDAGLADRYRTEASKLITEHVDAAFAATRTGDLFYRALSLGYDNDAAGRLADCWENWDMVSDPCAFHPNHSVTRDHQGYGVDGCTACKVIALSDAAGFVSKRQTTCRFCHTLQATTVLETGAEFIGSMVAPRTPGVPACERCHGLVLDTVEDGEDHTIIYLVFPAGTDVSGAFAVIPNRADRYPDSEIDTRAAMLARTLSPAQHIPRAGYIVPDPRKREAYDVCLDGVTSQVREMTHSEAGMLAWDHFGKPGIRIAPRLHVKLAQTPGRYADAESVELFTVSGDGTGRVFNREFRHRVIKYTGDNCCDRGRDIPGHLHMSAQPTVISAHPGTPFITVECRIGDVFTVDGTKYTLTNQRYADPLLIPA